MKSLIILALAAALAAGLFLSKPSQDSFTAFIKAQNQPAQTQTITDLGKNLLSGIVGSATSTVLTYHDHVFWATEDFNGQPYYFGMFGHWWKQNAATTTSTTPKASY